MNESNRTLTLKIQKTIASVFYEILLIGHVDPGESDMETALRETKEEAGLLSSDLHIFENVKQELNYQVNGKPKIVIYWLAELLDTSKVIQLSREHQAFKWLPFEEACSVAKYQDMQVALNKFNDYITKNLL